MIKTAELAGYFSAHALCSVAAGEQLIPILGYNNADSEKASVRLVGYGPDDFAEILDKNQAKATSAVLIYDGRLTRNEKKIDALIVEARSYAENSGVVQLAIPYTPPTPKRFLKSIQPLKIHAMSVVAASETWVPELRNFMEAVMAGVATHEQGWDVWRRNLAS